MTVRDRMPAVELRAGPERAKDSLRVELVSARRFLALRRQWTALCARAAVPNVFMDPVVVAAVEACDGSCVRVLLVWRDRPPGPVLVGVMAFKIRRSRMSWPFRALASPLIHVAHLGTPVLDRDVAGPTLSLMLRQIRADPDLPDLVEIGDLSFDLMAEFSRALAENGMVAAEVERRSRARLLPHPDPRAFWTGTMSRGRRQNLERSLRHLTKAGHIERVIDEEPEAVSKRVTEFLELEASGWKGRRKSALACDPATASFTRDIMWHMAQERLVTVHSLCLDGRAIAIWIVLRSGPAAFTWRTAYDPAYRQFSPGVLLLETVTTGLAGDGAVSVTDSCNHRDRGLQAERWPDRHVLVDLLIDVAPGPFRRVALLAARERSLRLAKETARDFRDHARKLWSRSINKNEVNL